MELLPWENLWATAHKSMSTQELGDAKHDANPWENERILIRKQLKFRKALHNVDFKRVYPPHKIDFQ